MRETDDAARKKAARAVTALALAVCAAIIIANIKTDKPKTYVIPLGGASPSVSATAAPKASSLPMVNVNTAGEEELCLLFGVGPAIARAIISEREANGPFNFPEDMLSVKGIGSAKLEGFRAQVLLE